MFTVIALFDMGRPDNSYYMKILSINETETVINATVKLLRNNGMATSHPVIPYNIVKIPKTNKSINWNIVYE